MISTNEKKVKAQEMANKISEKLLNDFLKYQPSFNIRFLYYEWWDENGR